MSRLPKLLIVYLCVLIGFHAMVSVSEGTQVHRSVTPSATVCPGALPPRLIPHGAALVVPGRTAILRSAANMNSSALDIIEPYHSMPVTGDPVCAGLSRWWPVDYYDIDHDSQYYSGWITESEQQSYVLQPQPSNVMSFSLSTTQTSMTIQYGWVRFDYDGAPGRTVHARTVHAEKVSPGNGLPDIGEHLLFTFEDPDVEPQGPPPTLSVYVVDDPISLNSHAKDQVEVIRSVLQQNPVPSALSRYMFESDPDKPEFGIYPPIFAEQWFRAQHKYLSFRQGAGIRFVAMYSRVTPQTTNDGLIYSVQAVSDSGEYLISAVIPITLKDPGESDVLLSSINNLQFEQYQQKVQEYGTEITRKIDQASSADFEPNLDSLDRFLTSLQFEKPSE